MNEKTFKLLEFDAVKTAVASFSMSEEAAERIQEERPRTEREEAERLRSLGEAVLRRLRAGEGERRESLPRTAEILAALEAEGIILDIEGVLALGLFIERGTAFKEYLQKQDVGEGACLDALLAEIPDCSGEAAEIFAVIDREGKLRDLPGLREIKRRIRLIQGELEHAADPYLESEDKRRMLQSPAPSQRDGRMVLAVKANFRGRIRGIIRDVSATGQTIFLEPEEVVEKNNELVLEEHYLEMEIRRILRELSARLRESRRVLKTFREKALFLETLRAKARYGMEKNCRYIAEGPFNLKQARHPLLGEAAIPLDLTMNSAGGEDIRTVIITGPNTGGKTVALKTAGLLALMNQSGIPLPAGEGAAMPFFDGVFADIGDEQSISQSLSTFSGHMTNIAGILRLATERSLVLLDELGSGTDPEEGSAIAMAILDHLIEKRARLIVTTHHGILKNYGYTRKGVENASMEFDSRTLSPAYRVIMGIPGESRALEVAGRNGLPEEVVRRARSYLDEERSDVSALIAELKERRLKLDEAVRAGEAERLRLGEVRQEADARELALRERERALREEGLDRLRTFIAESRKRLENLVRELREGEIDREKTLKVKEFVRGLEERAAAEEAALREEEAALRAALAAARERPRGAANGDASGYTIPPAPGNEALIGARRVRGKLLRQDRKPGFWIVETGSLRMSVPEGEIIPLPPSKGEKTFTIARTELASPDAPRGELSLRGMRLDEALAALERQIDGAVLSGLREFSVVHGKGEGVLQKGVHEYLKHSPVVEDYYFSRPELGGFGRTEVVLKSEKC